MLPSLFRGDPSGISTDQHVARIINPSRTYSPRAGKENMTAKTHKLDLLARNDFYAAFYLFPFPGQLRQFPANVRSSRVHLLLRANERVTPARPKRAVLRGITGLHRVDKIFLEDSLAVSRGVASAISRLSRRSSRQRNDGSKDAAYPRFSFIIFILGERVDSSSELKRNAIEESRAESINLYFSVITAKLQHSHEDSRIRVFASGNRAIDSPPLPQRGSESDGRTMSVPMARETLCQSIERILIITRVRYIGRRQRRVGRKRTIHRQSRLPHAIRRERNFDERLPPPIQP